MKVHYYDTSGWVYFLACKRKPWHVKEKTEDEKKVTCKTCKKLMI